MTHEEFTSILQDIYSETQHIRMNWSAPPALVVIVDMPEFLDTAMDYMPVAHTGTSAMFTYSKVWGVDLEERTATADVPKGIWIKDRDGIFHRVR